MAVTFPTITIAEFLRSQGFDALPGRWCRRSERDAVTHGIALHVDPVTGLGRFIPFCAGWTSEVEFDNPQAALAYAEVEDWGRPHWNPEVSSMRQRREFKGTFTW